MILAKEAIEKAVNWWAEKILEDRPHSNGDDMLTTQDWVTDWEVTTDFNGFPLKYPRVIDLCPQCRAMYGKRPLGVGGKIQHHV